MPQCRRMLASTIQHLEAGEGEWVEEHPHRGKEEGGDLGLDGQVVKG